MRTGRTEWATHHHLVTELVVERVGEKPRDGGEAVHHVQRQAAVVAQHHEQGTHVRVDLVHFNGGAFEELKQNRGRSSFTVSQLPNKTFVISKVKY